MDVRLEDEEDAGGESGPWAALPGDGPCKEGGGGGGEGRREAASGFHDVLGRGESAGPDGCGGGFEEEERVVEVAGVFCDLADLAWFVGVVEVGEIVPQREEQP